MLKYSLRNISQIQFQIKLKSICINKENDMNFSNAVVSMVKKKHPYAVA